jgi:16S rRNA (guanine966-N2)-methyltransferase
MRVIAGEFRGRRLKSLPGWNTRPTPDRLRESLFSILQPALEGALFVDAYAGTGAVGIEALSRGAERAVFLERHPGALGVLRENLQSLGLGPARATVLGGIVAATLPKAAHRADIVFLDPPYERGAEYEAALAWLGEHPVPLVIVQHPSKLELGETHGRLARYRVVRQGDNCLSFFAPTSG